MTASADRPAGRTGTRCPTCSAGAERGQLICLECGSRIALRHRRPPSWKVPVGIVVGVTILAAAGGVLAYEALDADAQREADSAPPRVAEPAGDRERDARAPDDAPSGGEPSLGGSSSDSTEGDTPATPPTDAGDGADAGSESAAPASGDQLVRDGDLFAWPRTLEGFTIVVQTTEDRDSATTFARSVAKSLDRQVGVIDAADFETLPKGFFVVFAGRYEGRPAADRAAVRIGRTYPGAFPQVVRG